MISSRYLVPLICAANASADPLRDNLDRIFEEMNGKVKSGFCVIVVKDGARIYDRCFRDFAPDKMVALASATKWISAAVVMAAVDEGKMRLDDPVKKFLPEFTGPAGEVTLRQAFSHTSGWGASESPCVMDRKTTLQACAEAIRDKPLRAAPGSEFVYGNTSMQVAGRMLEVATKKRWADYMAEKLTGPLGMKATLSALPDQDRNPLIAGGGGSSANDYLVFLDMLLHEGRVKGRPRVLSKRAVRDLETVASRQAKITASPYTALSRIRPGIAETPYALGNWVERDENGVAVEASSAGLFGFFPFLDRSRKTYGVIAVRDQLSNVAPYYFRMRDALRGVGGR